MRAIILLSGGVGAGKSSISAAFCERWNATAISSREILEEVSGARERIELQDAGLEIDTATNSQWLADHFASNHLAGIGRDAFVVIDAVRNVAQVDAFRSRFGKAVLHLHVHASEASRRGRFEARGESGSWDDVARHASESEAADLARDADLLVDTDQSDAEQVVYRIARRLGVGAEATERLVDVLVGGQWGSEGKGNVAAYLSPEYDLLVRTGGPNAGHSVKLPSGEKRVQYHLPSGTSTSAARLVLGPGAVIEPKKLLEEIRIAGIDGGRLRIDRRATIITDAHRELESGLVGSIGSTGQGVGAAIAGRILDRGSKVTRAEDVPELKEFVGESGEWIEETLAARQRVFVEGTQGSGLSLLHGDYPHVTSRDTSAGALLGEAGIAPGKLRRVVLVVRTYPIRVANPPSGTSGPLYREISWDLVAERSKLDPDLLREQEHTSTTRRLRRVGEFDWALLHESVRLNGPTDIALTFVDQLDAENQHARRFTQLSEPTRRFIGEVEAAAGAPVTLISTRFHARSVIDRRLW